MLSEPAPTQSLQIETWSLDGLIFSLTTEKDKRIYTLSGDPVGVKLAHRITLEGKRKTTDKKLVFEANRMIKDFGACPI
jgi:hypothetical protein